MKFKPMFDKVVIKPDAPKEASEGGILLPPSAMETEAKGIVVAAGLGEQLEDGKIIPMSVKVGDHVLYGKYAGSDIKIDGEDFVILEEESILGIFED